jgi:hypothetical protein
MTIPETFQTNYPFISCLKSSDIEYVGILINFDESIASIYDITKIKTEEEKNKFLELGEIWWWESNRRIPINIFLKSEMQPFKYVIKTLNSRDTNLIFGPMVNLSDIAEKRIKRKSIQLVRNFKRNHG